MGLAEQGVAAGLVEHDPVQVLQRAHVVQHGRVDLAREQRLPQLILGPSMKSRVTRG